MKETEVSNYKISNMQRTHHGVPETSRIAQRSFNASGDKYDHHRRILAALDFIEGTYEQIAARCGLSYHQVARRGKELVIDGKIADTGRKGKTSSGNPAIIWTKTQSSSKA